MSETPTTYQAASGYANGRTQIARYGREPEPDTFGAILRNLRERAEISQARLALLSGVSESMVSRLESNQREPNPETIEALADVLCERPEDALRLYTACARLPARVTNPDAVRTLLSVLRMAEYADA